MLVTALIMGFAGSLHCAGMCSPLVLAVSAKSKRVVLNRLIYNLGRILVYGVLGAVVSTLGFIIPLSKFQNLVSIVLGIVILLVGVGLLKPTIPVLSYAVGRITGIIKRSFAIFLKRKNYTTTFLLGMLNGLLPCGLVLIALTFCITLSSPIEGFQFMIFFGMGTLPVMFGLTTIIAGLVKRFNFSVQNVTTGILIASGIMLIARVFLFQLPHHSSIQQGVIDIVLCR
jgi:sulfite exporter TauE/SafE